MEECTHCNSLLPVSEFPKDPTRSRGYKLICKPCHARKGRELQWRKAGIVDFKLHDFDRMRDESQGCCNICGKYAGDSLHVDHDHETGAVRGLLCSDCNMGLGKLGDNLTGLQEAVDYLRNAQST